MGHGHRDFKFKVTKVTGKVMPHRELNVHVVQKEIGQRDEKLYLSSI